MSPETKRRGTVSMYQTWMKGEIDATQLLRAIHALGTFADTYRLTFEESSIECRVLDPSHVVAIGTSIPIDYQTDHESVTVGIDHDWFARAISFPGTEETVELRLNDGEKRIQTMTGRYIDESQLLEPDDLKDEPKSVDHDYETAATLESREFKAAVGAVSGPSDEPMRLTARSDTLRVESRAPGTGFENEWEADASVGPGYPQQTYSQSYLTDIAMALPPEGEVTVRFGDEMPVQVETENYWFELAPRLMEDS